MLSSSMPCAYLHRLEGATVSVLHIRAHIGTKMRPVACDPSSFCTLHADKSTWCLQHSNKETDVSCSHEHHGSAVNCTSSCCKLHTHRLRLRQTGSFCIMSGSCLRVATHPFCNAVETLHDQLRDCVDLMGIGLGGQRSDTVAEEGTTVAKDQPKDVGDVRSAPPLSLHMQVCGRLYMSQSVYQAILFSAM